MTNPANVTELDPAVQAAIDFVTEARADMEREAAIRAAIAFAMSLVPPAPRVPDPPPPIIIWGPSRLRNGAK